MNGARRLPRIDEMHLTGRQRTKILETLLRIIGEYEFGENNDEIEESQDNHGDLCQLVPAELPPNQLATARRDRKLHLYTRYRLLWLILFPKTHHLRPDVVGFVVLMRLQLQSGCVDRSWPAAGRIIGCPQSIKIQGSKYRRPLYTYPAGAVHATRPARRCSG